MTDKPSFASNSLLAQARILSEGGASDSSEFSPDPSAELISLIGTLAVKFAHAEKAIAKGQIKIYEQRAAALKERAIKATAEYRGAEIYLNIGLDPAFTSEPILDSKRFTLLKLANLKRYHSKRIDIAREALALWHELQAKREKRGRGRPKGSSSYLETDLSIHLETFKHLTAENPEGFSRTDYQMRLKQVVSEKIQSKKLHALGDSDSTNIDAHMKRLKKIFSGFLEYYPDENF
jgi:hypothetical protein